MSPSNEPVVHQLEPPNLLEPLDVAAQPVSAQPAMAQSASAALHSTNESFTAIHARGNASRFERIRWVRSSALIAIGAVMCVAAGAALPHLPTIMFGDFNAVQAGRGPETHGARLPSAEATERKSSAYRTPETAPADGSAAAGAAAEARTTRSWTNPGQLPKDDTTAPPMRPAPSSPAVAPSSPANPSVKAPVKVPTAVQPTSPQPSEVRRAETRSGSRMKERAQSQQPYGDGKRVARQEAHGQQAELDDDVSTAERREGRDRYGGSRRTSDEAEDRRGRGQRDDGGRRSRERAGESRRDRDEGPEPPFFPRAEGLFGISSGFGRDRESDRPTFRW
jgi:hypothetical protein